MRNPECRAALVTIFKLILAASPALSLLPAFPPQRRDRENADCIGGALIDRRRGRRGGTREAGSAGVGEGQGGGGGSGEEKGGGERERENGEGSRKEIETERGREKGSWESEWRGRHPQKRMEKKKRTNS